MLKNSKIKILSYVYITIQSNLIPSDESQSTNESVKHKKFYDHEKFKSFDILDDSGLFFRLSNNRYHISDEKGVRERQEGEGEWEKEMFEGD